MTGKYKQKGFTMIELIVVIVILGILAATALPKFLDLRTEAQEAAYEGLAGALLSAQANNAVAYKAFNGAKGIATAGKTCTEMANDLLQGGLPDGYSLRNLGNPVVMPDGSGKFQVCEISKTGTTQKSSVYMEVVP